MGDLVMSSVKRDVGVKDMGAFFPGPRRRAGPLHNFFFVVPVIYHYAGSRRLRHHNPGPCAPTGSLLSAP